MSQQLSPSSWTFSPPVQRWFSQTFEQPTPPQAQGWPAIERGDHTLILAPTGMGKTLAAFLWGIDALYRELTETDDSDLESGVRIVYVSPLKALNNDIHRNLRIPLAGIKKAAHDLDQPFPEIRLAVRSGDTPARERQAMVRKPPHILITTPESLYLLLTSPKARDMFQQTRTIIVDEIHTLVGSKRGVHLALSLERLASLTERPLQRIGLSATIHPLEEAARFLGGHELPQTTTDPQPQESPFPNRPVTIVDTHAPKALDLQVVTVVDDFTNLPGDSLWPTLIPELWKLIRQHETTLVFCNSRRQAERVANRLNEQLAAEAQGKTSGLLEDGLASGIGFMASGTGSHEAVVRAHHGSMSREARLEMEKDLKAGRLPVLVATSSLELGVDIGSVDLVIQLGSPKSVSQGLQRVGRSGHLVGQTSKGRIFPLHRQDVIEAAAVSGGMLRGEVEPTYTPRNPLDVLAQQIVAMVAVEDREIEALYQLIRRAYPYHDLSRQAFHNVLEMLAGRYPSQAHRELRPRISWDRVNHKLAALPGSQLLALTNGGTISDRGAFAAYLGEDRTKLGELDEEFIYETRVGDTFMLGSQVWRVTDMTDDRILVKEAPGATPRMPFWRGEFPWRPYQLGCRIGAFRRMMAEELQALDLPWQHFSDIHAHRHSPEATRLLTWLQQDYALDEASAWQIVIFTAGQLDSIGTVSSDQTIVVEIFEDEVGEPRMVVHSPFGGRVNGPWSLALANALRERTGVDVETQSSDDGILLRFPSAEADFPLDLVAQLGRTEARERLLNEMPDSAVFGARFRQNAARALLLPTNRPGRRTPFWLQRLKAKDLMKVVRQFDDFPILIETYRDCLEDVMDLPDLEAVLGGIENGTIEVLTLEPPAPSPVAVSLLRQFVDWYMYRWDTPKAERQLQRLIVNRDLLQDVLKDVSLADLLKPEAIEELTGQLQRTAPTSRVRTAEELAVILSQMGDLSTSEIAERAVVDTAPWIQSLSAEGRLKLLPIPTAEGSQERWISTEQAVDYEAAFDLPSSTTPESTSDQNLARLAILRRFLSYTGPTGLPAIQARYAFPSDWLAQALAQLVEEGQLAHGQFLADATEPDQYIDRRNLEQVHRRTLSMLRQEVKPVSRAVYADFLAHWQHLAPAERLTGEDALIEVLQQLRALPIMGQVWERDILPLRLAHYRPSALVTLCQQGDLVWIGSGGTNPRRSRVRFIFRGEGHVYLEPVPDEFDFLSAEAQQVYELLKSEGALFLADMQAVLDLPEAKLKAALTELFMSSLVTNDHVETLRQIIRSDGTPAGPAKEKRAQAESSLAAQLAARRRTMPAARGPAIRRPGQAAYRAAKRRVQTRLQQSGTLPAPESIAPQGRWSLVHRLGVLGRQLSVDDQVARQVRQLLQRWGVVTRESLALEEGAWAWANLYQQLRLMEMRGDVRRGYFVRGLPGPQFALPDVVEQLRAYRDAFPDEAPLIVMNACDPANLYGSSSDDGPLTTLGEPLAFSRLPSTWLVQWRGLPVVVAEGTGSTITTVQGHNEALLRRALQALLDHLSQHQPRITIQTWDEQPVLDSPGQSLLETLGFRRDYPAMTWEKRW